MARKFTTTGPVVKFRGGQFVEMDDEIALEYPLTVVLDGREFATIVCTPTDLDDLVTGFLAAEGVIRTASQIRALTLDDAQGYAHVETKEKRDIAHDFYTKRLIGSCCGKSRHFYFQNDAVTAKTVTSAHGIAAADCFSYMRELEARSRAFKQTGGVHNAALCGADGIIALRTDIGRHNALDKLYGAILQQSIRLNDKLIVFSGRLSSEVVLKVAKIGVGIILSKSAPTELALKLADELNITVVGFIRNGSFNVYTHPERVTDGASRRGNDD